MLHISVADVAAWYLFAKQQCADQQLVHARLGNAPTDAGYARVFHAGDPAGVLLHFAQIATA